MRYILLLALVQYLIIAGYGQTSTIKGTLVDSSDGKSAQNAVVVLLGAGDSLLLDFTRARANGSFQLGAPADTGTYVLLVTHPYFVDFSDRVTMKPGQSLDMGSINMISKAKLLDEVIVKGGAPIRIKGDTTIYTADSFKVRQGATVEELLKILPGIQVDRNGQIKALGEKVERLLVDGEEFFGSDPGIATKNLRADNVKDVQVYKGKSDQAAFTGIDDGQSKQTMNLVLKEDKKKGYFGKVELGGGLKLKEDPGQNKFNNAAMLNAFKSKRKIAGYVVMSNTGKLNLDWNDREKYGGSANMEVSDDGGIMFFGDGNDYVSSEGIPTNWNLGLHYSDKFNSDKESINAGYRLTKINAPAHIQTLTQSFVPDNIYTMNAVSNNYSSVLRQGLI